MQKKLASLLACLVIAAVFTGPAKSQTKIFPPSDVRILPGSPLDMSGSALVVLTVDASTLSSVQVYRQNGANWDHEATLTGDATKSEDNLADPVIAGDVIAAKAFPFIGTFATVAVFRRSGSWVREATLVRSDGGNFNETLDVSGDVVVVGQSDRPSSGTGLLEGGVYVFRFDGAAWIEEVILEVDDKDPLGCSGCQFGNDVAIDGNVLAVLGDGYDAARGGEIESVWIFRYDGSNWQEEATLIGTDVTRDDKVTSISLSGDVVVIGVAEKTLPEGAEAGVVNVFRYDGSTWNQEARLTASTPFEEDLFGESVSIQGSLLAVSAPNYDSDEKATLTDTSAVDDDFGAVYTFLHDGTNWLDQGMKIVCDPYARQSTGRRVTTNGEIVAATVPGDTTNSIQDGGVTVPLGAVYILDATSCTPTGRDHEDGVPTGYVLEQNYPNPFNPSTSIAYTLPNSSHVTLSVFDLLGRKVQVLVDGTKPGGDHSVVVNASGIPSGIYAYRIEAAGFVDTKSFVVLK